MSAHSGDVDIAKLDLLAQVSKFLDMPKALPMALPAIAENTATQEGRYLIRLSGCLRGLMGILISAQAKNLAKDSLSSTLTILINMAADGLGHFDVIDTTLASSSSTSASSSSAAASSSVEDTTNKGEIRADWLTGMFVSYILTPQGQGEVAGLAAILLSNLTHHASVAELFLKAHSDLGLLKCLVQLVVNTNKPLLTCWLHQLLANLTQLSETRRFLLQAPATRLGFYAPLLNHGEQLYRRAAIQILRNCLFETEDIPALLKLAAPNQPAAEPETVVPSLFAQEIFQRLLKEEDPGLEILLVECLSLIALVPEGRDHLQARCFLHFMQSLTDRRTHPDTPKSVQAIYNRLQVTLSGQLAEPSSEGVLFRAEQVPYDEGEEEEAEMAQAEEGLEFSQSLS